MAHKDTGRLIKILVKVGQSLRMSTLSGQQVINTTEDKPLSKPLAHVRYGSNFKSIIYEHMVQI